MEFAKAIHDEAHAFNVINMQVLEFDEGLSNQELRVRRAIEAKDAKLALEEARTLRGLIIELGYADDDELPTED